MILNRKLIGNILLVIALILLGYYLYHLGASRAEVKTIKKEIKVVETKIDTIKERIKGDEKVIVKYVDKIKEIERKEIVYDTLVCSEIVAKKDSIILYKDSIIDRKDSIIFKERVIIEYKDTIIEKIKEIPCKKKPSFWLGVAVGAGGTLLLKQ